MVKEILKCTKSLNLLYVEDDELIQSAYSDLFSNLFKSITIANDGLEALKKYKNNKFDIIISDIRMPNMNGIDFITKVREEDENILIIIYSAWNELENLKPSNNLNISGYMSKPIQTESMIKIFKKVLCTNS